MEKYCKKLREWVMKIVNYEMKKMIPLLITKIIIMKSKTNVSYAIKDFVMIMKVNILKIIEKFMIIVTILVNIEVRLTVFAICVIKQFKKIPVIFHNGSKYDWHLIIKELAKEFDCGELNA